MNNIWNTIKGWATQAYTWLIRYPLALVISIGIVALAVVLLVMGFGDRFDMGGLIGRLFGTRPKDKANVVPDDREVPMGSPDEHGWVQHEVDVLDVSSNPFRDKGVIRIKTPEGGIKKVTLPSGVHDTDVDKVIVVGPTNVQVVIKSAPDRVDNGLIDSLR